jgi:hypothetical protein
MPLQVAVQPIVLEPLADGLRALQTASVNIGPSDTDNLTVTATGIPTWGDLGVNFILQCFLQARQSLDVSTDEGWNDEFALQYIGSEPGALGDQLSVTFKILRLDVLYDSSPPPRVGWGQDLWVDILLINQQTPAIQ